MNILKRNITQIILVGFLFALVSGTLSFFAFDLVKKTELKKKIVIIDTASDSLFSNIQNLYVSQNSTDQGYRALNAELHESLNYTVLRYQRSPKLAGGCHTIQYALLDNSIFIVNIYF